MLLGGGGGCNSESLINLDISLEQSTCHSMCVQGALSCFNSFE